MSGGGNPWDQANHCQNTKFSVQYQALDDFVHRIDDMLMMLQPIQESLNQSASAAAQATTGASPGSTGPATQSAAGQSAFALINALSAGKQVNGLDSVKMLQNAYQFKTGRLQENCAALISQLKSFQAAAQRVKALYNDASRNEDLSAADVQTAMSGFNQQSMSALDAQTAAMKAAAGGQQNLTM